MDIKIIHKKYFNIAIYIILTLVIYAQTNHFDFSIDDDLIKENVVDKIYHFSDLGEIFKQRYNRVEYRPITVLAFGIEHLILGELNPKISHLINVFIFILIVFSAHQLLQLIFNRKYVFETFFIVALFTVHPLCVEVVSNLKSRDGLLSMFFALWSLYYFIQFDRNKNWLYLLLSCLLFTIGLFAKIDIAGMILFVMGYYFIKFDKKAWLKGIGIAIVFILLFTIIRESLVNYFVPIDKNSTSTLAVTTFTENPIAGIEGFFVPLFSFIQTICIYLLKLVLPKDLLYYYGYKYYDLSTNLNIKIVLESVLLIGIVAWIIYLSKKNKYILISGIGFISFIFYATNFITPVAGIVADRYAFMSIIWFCSLVVLITTTFFPIEKTSTQIGLGIIIIIFTFLSYQRTKVWKNELSLIEHDAPKLQQSHEGMRIASGIYYDEYKKNNDETYLDKALKAALQANKIYNNNLYINTQLGQLYFLKNDKQNAEKYLKAALKVDTSNAVIFQYLGDIAYTKKDYQNAEFYYLKSYNLAKDLQKQNLINNISSVYYEQGLKQKTIDYNLNLIQQDSSNFAAFENLAYLYLLENNYPKAKEYFNFAVRFGLPTKAVPNF